MRKPPNPAPRDVDTWGVIQPEVSLTQVRPPYLAVVEALSAACQRAFADALHSLYLTGSVVKGTAPLATQTSMR